MITTSPTTVALPETSRPIPGGQAQANAAMDAKRFLQSTLDALSAHIAILDEAGNILAVNAAWIRFARANHFADDRHGLGVNYLNLCDTAGQHEETSREMAAGLRAVMAGQRDEFSLEYPCHSPTAQRWFCVRTTRFGGDGPLRVVVAHENITPYKLAEAALRWKTAFLEAQVKTSIDGILVADAQGRKILQNRQLSCLFRIPPDIAAEEDDTNQLRWVTSRTKDPERFLEKVAYLYAHPGEVSRDEIELQDGTTLDRYTSPVTGPDGTYYGRLWTFRDITARKQDELQLRKLGRAVEQSPVSIVVTDLQGAIEYVNPKFCAVTGYLFEEVRGKNPRLLKSGQMPREAYRQMWAAITAGEEWRGEFHNRKKNGELYWESAIVCPVRDDQGKVTHFVAVKEDITGRRQMEELLRLSEEKFRGLVENLRDAVMTVEPETKKFSSANAAGIRMFGAKNEVELISFGPVSLSPERQMDGSLSEEKAGKLIAALAEGPQRFEWLHRQISGTEFFAEVMLTRMEHGGKPVLLSTIRDITARKQAEETLREKERLLSESQRLGHIGSWFGDVTGPLSWSEETYRIYGVAPDTFTPSMDALLGLVLPADRPTVVAWQTRCAAGQSPGELEFRIRRPDGSIRFIKRNGAAVYDADNRFIHMAGTVQDITEQKALEAQVQQQRAEQAVILNSIGDGVHWIDANGRIRYENPAAARMLGYEAAELLDRPAHSTMHHTRADGSAYPQGECPIYATLHDRRVRRVTNDVFWRKDGTSFAVEYSCTPVYERDGASGGTVVVFTDVTDRKRAQTERENLERLVAEHRANEENARLALVHEQKLSQVKSRFVSLVSHEFRTPLSIINTAAQLLDAYADKMTGAERSGQFEEIEHAVARMTQMMNDFLVYGNFASGTLECKPARVAVAALCRRFIAEVLGQAGRSHPIELTVDSAVGEAFLDEKILRHILGNLLSNAVKYSQDGQPVKLEVRRLAGSAQLCDGTGPAAENCLAFKISDSGIGIPAADLPKLYQTFHRAANVGNRPGTGMGLAIVKQFVELHRGTIRIASEEGIGTTVWVELPAGAPASPAPR